MCKNRPIWFKAKSPLKPDLDPISPSRPLLFPGTISYAKHRQRVVMAGIEYFGTTAQPRDHATTYPGKFYLSTPCRNSTITHFRRTYKTIDNHTYYLLKFKMARPSIFKDTPSIFESLIPNQIYLFCKTILIHELH